MDQPSYGRGPIWDIVWGLYSQNCVINIKIYFCGPAVIWGRIGRGVLVEGSLSVNSGLSVKSQREKSVTGKLG